MAVNEVRAAGYAGGYGRVRDYVRAVRPRELPEPVVRFETPAGRHYVDPRVMLSPTGEADLERLLPVSWTRRGMTAAPAASTRLGPNSGRSAPCVRPKTPGGHQREHVRIRPRRPP